jgi:hypothetical protein
LWNTCNYPTVLKEKDINRKNTTCAICWLKSVLHDKKRWEQGLKFYFLHVWQNISRHPWLPQSRYPKCAHNSWWWYVR